MIPFDPALPYLDDLLDGASMREVLVERGIALDAVTPDYLRYKPGTSCTIRYRLEGAGLATWATVLTDANGKHAQRTAKRRIRELPSGALPATLHMPEFDALWFTFPNDYDLVALPSVLDRRRFAAAVPGTHADREPEVIRYKPGRKALVRHGDRYAKMLTDARGAMLSQVTADLIRNGLPTPPVARWIRPWQTIVHDAAPGTPLFGLRQSPYFTSWMAPFAETLDRLHTAPVTGMPRRSLADVRDEVARLAAWLRVVTPGFASLIDLVAGRLSALLAAIPDVYVPIHGDAWDDQVLVGPAGPWLIDLDEVHLGHPLIDIGNVLAHLAAAGLGDAHDAFLEACGHSRFETLPFEALGLLRLAPRGIRALRDDALDEVEKHLRAALALLSEDPKLPQLPLIGCAVHSALGTVERIEMVRHKEGRRAIFRIDTPEGRIYGKTFASGRGPKVYGILRTIVKAQAFGDDVALPAPVAWIPEVKLLLQRGIPGEAPGASLLHSRPELMTQVALALARFHASGLDLGRAHLPTQELAPIAGRLDDVAAVDAALADRGRRVLAAIDLGTFPWREQPIHRDCYHEQFVIDGDRLGVLDLDDAAMGEPAVDIANMLAHLSLLEVQAGVDLDAARARFRHAAFAWDPGLNAALVDVLTATTCLRLAGIHVSRERGHALATAMIGRAESIVVVCA